MIDIRQITELDSAEMQPLVAASRAEQLWMVDKLLDQYTSGINRFDQPGEALFGVFAEGALIGIGGLNRDPYASKDATFSTGRARRLYILPEWRNQGVGAQLMQVIISAARLHFDRLTLRTVNDDTSRFYDSLGFQTEPAIENVSHYLDLTA